MRFLKTAVLVLVSTALFAVGSPAIAEPATPTSPLVVSTRAVVDGVLISAQTGTYGTSSKKGCSTVKVTTTGHTIFGQVSYRYKTWTHWCWNRTHHRVRKVTIRSHWSGISTMQFDKRLNVNHHYYKWYGSVRHSGYLNTSTAQMDNVIPVYGTVKTDRATNRIRVHSNGTVWYESEHS